MNAARVPAVVDSEIVRARLASQLLTGEPAHSVEAVVGRILAVQAQDPRGARLAVRARSAGLTAADVDRAFTDDRSIVITWLNRGTLHLVRRGDYFWLLQLLAQRSLPWNEARLRDLGVSAEQAERSVELIVRLIERDGRITRAQVTQQLREAGLPAEGQQIPHQVALASFRGLIVRGPMRGREQCYVLVRDWLGEAPPFDRDRALAELARRYLAGHGPTTAHDLAYWTGLPGKDARAALRLIADELEERNGFVSLSRRGSEEPPPPPPARLLGPFDPLLHGWRSRVAILGPHQSLVTMNGIFKPTLLVAGRAVGTWTMPKGKVLLDPFEPLPPEALDALQAESLDVERFMVAKGPAPRPPEGE